MLHKLRHLWDADASRIVSPEEYASGYRCGHCTGAGQPYTVQGQPWCWLRRLLRLLGRDPRNVYGWFMTREDVPDA